MRPFGNANFIVDLGLGADPHSAAGGFAEVIFPTLLANTDVAAAGQPPQQQHLVLRRGLIGNLDLFGWWQQARHARPQAPGRTVSVQLLGDDHASVLTTWRFLNARPVSLHYSPLRATEGSVVMETLELAFDGVELVHGARP